VAICTPKFGGKKHTWVDLKLKGENREPFLKVDVGTLFYLQCRTPAAVFGYHPSLAKLAFWTQFIIARLL